MQAIIVPNYRCLKNAYVRISHMHGVTIHYRGTTPKAIEWPTVTGNYCRPACIRGDRDYSVDGEVID